MLKLIQKSEMPPGGLRYLVPETSTWIPSPIAHGAQSCSNLDELLEYIRAHYKANQYEPPKNLQALVEDQICKGGLPDGFCADADTGSRGGIIGRIFRGFSINAVLQGTSTLVDHVLTGRVTVSDAEASRRAAICLKCPKHGLPDGCTGCSSKGLHNMINVIIGGKPPIVAGNLMGCKVCGCLLEAMVRVKLPTLLRHTTEEQLAEYKTVQGCWKLEEARE